MILTGKILDQPGRYAITTHNEEIVNITQIDTVSYSDDPLILPGLMDIQINGYGGYDFNGPKITAQVVINCIQSLWRVGVTAICPTLITGSLAATLKAIAAIKEAYDTDQTIAASILGIHLEGPYISSEEGPRGAHSTKYTRDPNWNEWLQMEEAGSGLVNMITLAPERKGALDFIEPLVRQGVLVAIGHTAAEPEQISAAIERGAKLVTHLGNGVHEYLHRHDSYFLEGLARDELAASLIADGIHLPDRVIRTALRTKGVHRTILISDSLGMAGLPPGDYPGFAGITLRVLSDGRIVRADTGKLSGSSKNVVQCVDYVRKFDEAGLTGAVKMTTQNPAALFGRESMLGSIAVGQRADFTVLAKEPDLDDRLEVIKTVVAGQVVFEKNDIASSIA